MSTSLLRFRSIGVSFQGVRALDDFSLNPHRKETVGLIGPNGAGKTTVFNVLSGLVKPDSGVISLQGRNMTRLPPDEIARRGICRTFQNLRLFKSMTVLENVLTANHQHSDYSVLQALFLGKDWHKQEQEFEERAHRLLKVFGLLSEADRPATSLSYGDQRKVEIVRALATDPLVLLLDEPTAGMNPKESDELIEMIAQVQSDFFVSILLIEHHMKSIARLCPRVLVLDHGVRIAEGSPTEIQKHPEVIRAYLGKASG